MVGLKVPIRILGALMWKNDIVQEGNSKFDAWNVNTDHTILKTHGSIPTARFYEATIRGSKEVGLAVVQGEFWN